MKLGHLEEPLLEFGAGNRHVDARFALAKWGPLDRGESFAPKVVRMGVVGTSRTIDGFSKWIERIGGGIPGKKTHLAKLFPSFPGYGEEMPLEATLMTDSGSTRQVPYSRLKRLVDLPNLETAVVSIAELFLEELAYLRENNSAVDVLVCALPPEVLKLLAPLGKSDDDARTKRVRFDLHDYLKSQAMRIRCPTQLVLPTTYGEKITAKILAAVGQKQRQLQDEATRAWNFYIANYYKAGGTPWKMVRDLSALTTCYVGVSFYHTTDGSQIKTSLAQVFDERGLGIIVRGGTAVETRRDRTPHLLEDDAYALLASALHIYRKEHRTIPARVVVHKTSKFFSGEVAGFGEAVDEQGIEELDLVHLRPSSLRLFREGQYPPLRGTYLSPTEDDALVILNTRGSIPFYRTYPGMYIPKALEIAVHQSEHSAVELAEEVLALTKMNWNNTQFDSSDPITIRGSRKVGELLRYAGENDVIEPRYAYYM